MIRSLLPPVAAFLVLSGCGQAALAPGEVRLREFEVDVDGSQWAEGSVALDVVNEGEFSHTLVVSGPGGEVVGATEVIQPGDQDELVVDLAPGRYQLTCRIVARTSDGRLVDHFERGMHRTIEVRGPAGDGVRAAGSPGAGG